MSRTPGFSGRFRDLTGTDPDRIEAISDGIFSVGMTLLVLGLTVPVLVTGKHTTDTELWTALRDLAPKVLIYILSFMTLGIFWIAQGSQTGLLARSNRNYAWIQLAFLFAVTLVPFLEENQRQIVHVVRGRIFIAQSLYATATLLSFVFPTWVSVGLIFLVQLNYVLAPRIPILDRY